MSVNPSSGDDDGGISIGKIVNRVIERIWSRLIGGILLVGGSIGSGFIEIGDALEDGILAPLGFVAGSIGSIGDSLIQLFLSLDQSLLAASQGAGLAAPIVILVIYGATGAILAIAIVSILSLIQRLVPIL